MTTNQVRAFRGSAVAFFGAGLAFLLTDNITLGLCFLMIAIAFIASSTKRGSEMAQNRPLLIVMVLAGLILLVGVIAAVFLLPQFF